VVICLERGADLHIAQLMPLPLTVSRFSIIQTGFTFLVAAHPGSLGQRAVKWMRVYLTRWLCVRSPLHESQGPSTTCIDVAGAGRQPFIYISKVDTY